MSHLRAGALNRRITLQQGTPGSTTEGDATLTWTPLGDVWANIAPIGVTEQLLAAQRGEQVTHTVIIRYQPQFLPAADLRILYGTRTFFVEGTTDLDEAHKALSMRCREFVSTQLGAV